MKAVGIIWDVDYEEDLELLPKEEETAKAELALGMKN